MNDLATSSFPFFRTLDTAGVSPSTPNGLGVAPYQSIAAMLNEGAIVASTPFQPDQIQPASIDLRLGGVAYRVRASFLPGATASVMDKINELDGYAIDISEGAVLEKGCVYVIPLLERLNLRGQTQTTASANPKSSTGRLDILTRLITDFGAGFDEVASQYNGPLYVEVAPRTFSVVVREGSRLTQMRFRRGTSAINSSNLRSAFERGELVHPLSAPGLQRDGRVPVTIDLKGSAESDLVGYRAQKHTDRIDIEMIGHYTIEDFWEPIRANRTGRIVLNPDDFYILTTRESVAVPPEYAAEMVAYDTTIGEFRVHYAGFFDPGFGHGVEGAKSKAVLEVRSHEVPFMLEHGQIIGWLRYERMAAPPDRLYGRDFKSNYQNQGLRLAKQFRQLPA